MATDIHELAHHYFDLSLSGCSAYGPASRWFEEGVAELVEAIDLKQHRPEALRE